MVFYFRWCTTCADSDFSRWSRLSIGKNAVVGGILSNFILCYYWIAISSNYRISEVVCIFRKNVKFPISYCSGYCIGFYIIIKGILINIFILYCPYWEGTSNTWGGAFN